MIILCLSIRGMEHTPPAGTSLLRAIFWQEEGILLSPGLFLCRYPSFHRPEGFRTFR